MALLPETITLAVQIASSYVDSLPSDEQKARACVVGIVAIVLAAKIRERFGEIPTMTDVAALVGTIASLKISVTLSLPYSTISK